jgi:hypothetical protein
MREVQINEWVDVDGSRINLFLNGEDEKKDIIVSLTAVMPYPSQFEARGGVRVETQSLSPTRRPNARI